MKHLEIPGPSRIPIGYRRLPLPPVTGSVDRHHPAHSLGTTSLSDSEPDSSQNENIRYLTLDDAIYDQHAPDFDPVILTDGLTPQTAVNPVHNLSGSGYSDLKSPGFLYPPSDPSAPGYKYDTSYSPDPLPPKQLLTPLYVQTASPKRKHPLFHSFEAPRWETITLHTLLCVIAYPILMICVVISKDRTLFWTRFITGLGCGLVGAALSVSILVMGRPFLEAATWATVIHQSRAENAPGVKLKDLAAESIDATSSLAALKLLWDRAVYTGTSRQARKDYDRRHWTFYILFFLFLLALAASIPFTLGRLVDITTTLTHQTIDWEEVVVSGVNSATDITKAKALEDPFNNFALTWTLSPFSHRDSLPPVASFQYDNDTVFFSETTLSQLVPNGHGFGTFDIEPFNSTNSPVERASVPTTRNALQPIDPGYVLRFPKWGTRLHCVSLPDPQNNMIPKANSTFTYMFTPRQVLRDLFSSFNLEYNETRYPPLTTATIVGANVNDTLPPGLNPADTALSGVFYDNGVAVSFFSRPYSMGADGKGWISIEQVLIRLNTTYAPNGTFARLSDLSVPDATGNPTFIGYDGAICLQLFEPWIVETYNGTTGAPSARRLVGPGKIVQDIDGEEEEQYGRSVTDPEVTRELNSTDLTDVYIIAHTNSVNSLLKDNGRDAFYVPSQTLVSFSGGEGPTGFTQLSPDLFGQSRGSADAINILPYFAGSGKLAARRFPDKVLSSASIRPTWMITYLGGIFAIGLIASFFVPKLPLNVPRRGFQLYSWLAMFYADELVSSERGAIGRNMELEDIEKHVGELRFRYVNPRVTRYEVSPS